jgi:hypothetical protein
MQYVISKKDLKLLFYIVYFRKESHTGNVVKKKTVPTGMGTVYKKLIAIINKQTKDMRSSLH